MASPTFFITHDLRVVRAMSHEVVVLKAGKVVERGTTAEVFAKPQHDYTRMLLASALAHGTSIAS